MKPDAISSLSLSGRKVSCIGDKLRLSASCQEGLGDRLRRGLARFGRVDLTIPKSRFSGAVK